MSPFDDHDFGDAYLSATGHKQPAVPPPDRPVQHPASNSEARKSHAASRPPTCLVCGNAVPARPVQRPEDGAVLTEAQVNALTGDDIAYWISNPFLTPELLVEKVCWWVTKAAEAEVERAILGGAV